MNEFFIIFKNEFAQQHQSFADGILCLDEVMRNGFDHALKTQTPFKIFRNNWTDDEFETMKESLGVLATKYGLVKDDPPALTLLSALHFIILFETKGDIAERRLRSWMEQYLNGKKDENERRMDRAVQRFFKIDEMGITGKSDTYHLRNGFAHGHFKLKGNDRIVLWDEKMAGKGKKELFRAEMNPAYIRDFNLFFERKMYLTDLYPLYLGATEILTDLYGPHLLFLPSIELY